MEITDAVVDEACTLGCDTIVTFHPLIYVPLQALANQDRVARLVARILRADISVVSVHTSFDAFPQGTNALLAEKLGLSITGPLEMASDGLLSTSGLPFGMGVVTACNMSFDELLHRVHSVCGGPLRYSMPVAQTVTKVAIVAGSGMSLYKKALSSGAEVFITADVKYHDFHAATSNIGIIDPGHYEMEQFVPQGLCDTLTPVCDSCTLIASSVVTSPVQNFPHMQETKR